LNNNSKPHILCVDDDDKIRTLICQFLHKNDFLVSTAENTNNARNMIIFYEFDLIILDIMMPNEDGITFLKNFRKSNLRTPILMLTALGNIEKKIKTFQLGCDDYLIKPFEPIELILRIKKLLEPRAKSKISHKVIFGDYEYDINLSELRNRNKIIKLTNQESSILKLLCENINLPVSRELAAQKIGIDSKLRSVDVVITRLRKKIENDDKSSFLKTLRGKGYILKSDYEN